LFEELGGQAALNAAVDLLYERLLADPVTCTWFEEIDMVRLRLHQQAFLAVVFDGPELYDGRSMRIAHSGLGISDAAYTAAVAHAHEVFVELGVEPDLVTRAVRSLELLRPAIVESREPPSAPHLGFGTRL
jgi:hemoglobin